MTLLFPGSFDPFTTGHDDIVRRALAFAQRVVVAIGIHPTKHGLFTPQQRQEAIRRVYADEKRVEVMVYEGLTTDLALRVGADAIVRGVRNVTDFEYERNIAEVNRRLTGIETILLFADPSHAAVSSSVVRELMAYGKDVTPFLPLKSETEKMKIQTEK